MKKFLLLMLSLSTLCFANSQKGKIDMHGGHSDSLIIDNQNSFHKQKYNNFSDSLKKDQKEIKNYKKNKNYKEKNKIEKNRG
ncbi:hypothetical protein CPU12_06100 [Malaciobacter molluscorum LMG 25693]|uniref:Uncharacterized protein n=1 Tax=Malaciobacter molluscorum LMG 25693 TaxID=870501 RepID=A0A2G1DIF7_9BACT|nr:hypothetical protein [Malaciobacter molluscorum]AXX91880.1 hypothetical protein AMOL_0886 [Malaciobacter molluscorum LMG 25693]PHO18289.1 hypothetical protein CPU12_06100 [Malaciobacter molluscorum LMG 25693]RXJ94172.1 hypothetical protein CRV00_08045 [Malaciobacter molluscorum]